MNNIEKMNETELNEKLEEMNENKYLFFDIPDEF